MDLGTPWPRRLALPALLVLAALAATVPSAASAATFSNGAGIAINDPEFECDAAGQPNATPGEATPYPSTIAVSGFSGTVGDLNVTITGLSHTFPDDVGIVLVGPTGASTVLMEDSGGSAGVSGVNLTFDDGASSSLPDSSQITSGAYKPSQGTAQPGGDCTAPSTYPDAPAGPYGSTLAGFNGTNPNGTWSLYVIDDTGGDTGSITGWSITVAPTNSPPVCSGVTASPGTIQPATRDQFKTVALSGASDPDGDTLSYHIDAVSQDEPVSGTAVGDDTTPDALLVNNGDSNQVQLRAERNPKGNGRVYRIAYTVTDSHGASCSKTIAITNAKVGVPRKKGVAAVDDYPTSYNSLGS